MKRRVISNRGIFALCLLCASWTLSMALVVRYPQITWSSSGYLIFGLQWAMIQRFLSILREKCRPTYSNLSRSLIDETVGSREFTAACVIGIGMAALAKFQGYEAGCRFWVLLTIACMTAICVIGTAVYASRRSTLAYRLYRWHDSAAERPRETTASEIED